jgi:FKBP-type peptidyl-prolyl cis-trans isomerase SlyD
VSSPLRVARDCFVVLDWVLYDEDGDVIEETDNPEQEGGPKPVSYVHGYATLVPGLERALLGMAPGETQEVVVPPDQAYGAWDPDKEIEVDRAELPARLEVEDEILLEDEDGEEMSARVVEIHDDHVLLDQNHPLAGVTLRFDVVVREVRPATPQEIAAARAAAPRPSLKVLSPEPPAPPPDPPPPTPPTRQKVTKERAAPQATARGKAGKPKPQSLSDDEQ